MSHPLLHANTPLLAAILVSSIAAVAVALFADRIFARRVSAAPRHAAILAALLVAPLLLTIGLAGVRVPRSTPVVTGSAEVSIAATPKAAPVAERSEIYCALAVLWAFGVIVSLARTTLETLRWRGVHRRAEILQTSAFGAWYPLARSSALTEPAVIGIVQPMVVLPADYDLSPQEMRAVFAHELAHIERRDNLAALLVRLAGALLWFDPVHRLARRKLVELRERACDELVIEGGCDAADYASALARSCERSVTSPAVACMSGINLQERMESVMTESPRRRWPLVVSRLFVGSAVMAIAIAFAAFAPAPQLHAGEGTAPDYDFDVRVMPHPNGTFTLNVRIDSPDGNFSSVAVVRSAPDTRTISTTNGGKAYAVTVNLAADGSANATFEVREGETLLRTMGRSFAAPVGVKPATEDVRGIRRLGEDPNLKPPRVVSRVEPAYTVSAKIQGISGVVILEAVISETGVVDSVRVLKGLPEGLDQAAVDAVRQWRFEPATLDGKPVPVIFNLTINFKAE